MTLLSEPTRPDTGPAPTVVPASDEAPSEPELLRDPTSGPPEPDASTSRTGRRWRGRLLIVVLVAAFVALGVRQVTVHAEQAGRSPLEQVTLSADPVEVGATVAGVVDEVVVRPGQPVERGQLLLTVQTGPWAVGGPLPGPLRLEAPTAGTVSDLDLRPGSSVSTGEVVVRLYQPNQLHFRAEVPSAELPDLEVGMTGELRAGRIGPVAVRLTRIEPRLNGDATGEGTSTLVLTPTRIDEVEDLVPGLRFEGWLDRDSVPSGS